MLAELQRNVQRAGSYAFNADITQHTVPVASVYNVGQTSQRQDMRMQGETDLRNNAFNMTLWSEGGNILDLGTGIEIQAKDGKTLARQTGEAWQEIGAMSPSVMPQGDFLTFLTAATNVEKQGEETRNGVQFTRYTFQIDGKAFAEIVRKRTEAELRGSASLAPDRTLALSPVMAEMTGDGELWVTRDEAGRAWPLRQLVQLRFPAQDGVWSSASITVNFRDFGAEPALLLPSMPMLSPWLDALWRFLPFFLTGALSRAPKVANASASAPGSPRIWCLPSTKRTQSSISVRRWWPKDGASRIRTGQPAHHSLLRRTQQPAPHRHH